MSIENKDESPKSAEKKIRGIIRIAATDVNGNLSVVNALRKIKGVSFVFSRAICIATSIDPNIKIGSLNEEEISRLEKTVKNPGFKPWMLNAQKRHLIGGEIDLSKRENINILQKTRAYRGIRHELGLPVRGQRTRGSFRKNKTVGVVRSEAKKARMGAAPAKEK